MHTQLEIPSEVLNQWQNIVEIMAEIIHVPSAIITRVFPPYIEVFRASENPENPYKQGLRVEMTSHYCEKVVQTKNKLHVPDARQSEEWKNAPEIEYGIIAYLGYPICWPNGDIFGTICVLDDKENHFCENYEKLLRQFRNLAEAHISLIYQNQIIEKKNAELEHKQKEIKMLRSILPICPNCKKIRNGQGYWEQVETYIQHHSNIDFSHAICPTCAKQLYGELVAED